MRILTLIFVMLMMCTSASISAQKQNTRPGSKTQPTPQPTMPPRGGIYDPPRGGIYDPQRLPTWTGPIPAVGNDTVQLPSVEEMTALGAFAFEQKEYTEAYQWCRLAADKRSADAQYLLGDMFLYGKGVDEDHRKAAEWYRKAADQEHAQAQYLLATLLYFGDGMDEDVPQARDLALRSAEKGNAMAQFLLGLIYSNGEGMPVDIEEARKWYRLAAEQGLPAAQAALESM